MSLTTFITANAVLDLLVIIALFRVMWFGISKPYDELHAAGGHQPGRKTTEHEQHAARHARHAA